MLQELGFFLKNVEFLFWETKFSQITIGEAATEYIQEKYVLFYFLGIKSDQGFPSDFDNYTVWQNGSIF